MIRVFPRRTKWTPTDDLAFIGDPPLFLPEEQTVMVSCTFTADKPEAQRLKRAWERFYPEVLLGGPAFGDPGGEFTPGLFLKTGVTITSRGCIRKCPFCLVPKREGKLRELTIKDGWIVQDNNLLACSERHIDAVFEMLSRQKNQADFAAGLDSRLFTKHIWEKVKLLKPFPKLHFACDTPESIRPLRNVADIIGGSKVQFFCYVLIGYDPKETISKAQERLIEVWEAGFYPFAMLYQGPNGEGHKSKEWKQFQRIWCRPAAYKELIKSKLVGPGEAI